MNKRSFNKGDYIFKEGEPSAHLYIVETGRIEVFKTYLKQETILDCVSKGQLIGELSLFKSRVRGASARVKEAAVVTEVALEEFDAQIEQLPEWFKVVVKSIVNKLTGTTKELMKTNHVYYGRKHDRKKQLSHLIVLSSFLIEKGELNKELTVAEYKDLFLYAGALSPSFTHAVFVLFAEFGWIEFADTFNEDYPSWVKVLDKVSMRTFSDNALKVLTQKLQIIAKEELRFLSMLKNYTKDSGDISSQVVVTNLQKINSYSAGHYTFAHFEFLKDLGLLTFISKDKTADYAYDIEYNATLLTEFFQLQHVIFHMQDE
jgi:hypothetical protein